MSLAIGGDSELLLDTARRFAAERCGSDVVRAVVDGKADGLPPFWAEVADLGWLGLAVAERAGGQGAGVLEQAIVVERLGHAMAPGPVLPTAWAAAVLQAATDPDVTPHLAALAGGAAPGAVALESDLSAPGDGIEIRVSGTATAVLGGRSAELLVAPIVVDGIERWGLVLGGGTLAEEARAGDGLDPTRPADDVVLDHAEVLLLPDHVDRAAVVARGVALAAAEAAGGAEWCVEVASAHARDRRQFGRPIGQFQAVKHRCADMLVRLEQIRALAWDAAVALDGDEPDGADARLAVAAAGAIAFDAYAEVAKACIQVLGGIGFTWEHDAHLYLRRATSLRLIFATGSAASTSGRVAVARAALEGVRRHLQLELPPEAEALRAEVATTVDAIAARPKDERRIPLADAGLIVPHWAPPWGRDAGAVEQLVIDQELRRARVRVPHLTVGAWAAPTIAAHGTAEQQERWVRPTLHGEITWCQLFSEPEAGSDLASLTTAARRTDGGWLLTGQKVWTTMAKEADWGICLARTNPDAPKHLGITYFIVDMATPGLDIRPLRELTGMEMFNEVFLDDVFVPDDSVIGEVDGGWPLARTTLANERVSMGSGSSFGGGIETLIGLVADGIPAQQVDAHLLDELGGLVAEAHSLAVMGLRTAVRSVTGAKPGPEASVRKLLGVEHDQRTQEMGLLLLGPAGSGGGAAAQQWAFGFLANRCLTIAGGTSEIQRNIIGERLLGLPRDPEPVV